ncbi:MAG TPA: tail fiber domain-containing protein [Pyrinomonadaceae bacterium]
MRQGSFSKHLLTNLVVLLTIIFTASAVVSQTTSFTYQGRLTEGGSAANGNYDLQFGLFDSLSGGTQVGSTQTLNTVAVSNGVFTVSLDFGANAFNGASRFLEISTRPSGGGSFTLLSPRQPITSTPYAVRSLNAATADNVPAATIINATTQYNLNGSRILSSSGTNNLFVGTGAGTTNTTGTANSFFGTGAGTKSNSSFNSFFGNKAGAANTTGAQNSFFGSNAGVANATGSFNAFFGNTAGAANINGFQNAFFGEGAGSGNTTGSANSFFGTSAGATNTTGNSNAFFGQNAGSSNTTGSENSAFGVEAGGAGAGIRNTFIGYQAGVAATGDFNTFIGSGASFFDVSPSGNRNTLLGAKAKILSGGMFSPDNATAIGANAQVDQANSLVLGSINGVNGATADTKVGIGITAPQRRLHIRGTGSDGFGVGDLLVTGTGTVGSSITLEATTSSGRRYSWISTGTGADSGPGALAAFDSTAGAYRILITSTGNVGIGTTSPSALLSVNGSANKPGGGSWTIFSDERLKNIRGRFTPGLTAILQLQPLRYEYKPDNALKLKSEGQHIGFSAQAVQKIIPEAVTTDDRGYLLVNNDPILWTMLNAIKEQQQQIEELKKLVCRTHRRVAAVCR